MEVISTRDDYGLYVKRFLEGGEDPEDSAPHFQQLLAEIVSVAKYHSQGVVNNHNLIAYEVEFVFSP